MQLIIEEWRDIDFTQGRYQVSNTGKIRRISFDIVKSNGIIQHLKSMNMKLRLDPDGYQTVGFSCKDIGLYKTVI